MVTGVETAGLVLAAIPLLLILLDKYRDGMKRTSVFFRRKKHIEKLCKALVTQRVLLNENVKTLLLRVEIDFTPEKEADLFDFLRSNQDAKESIEQFLGKEAYASYLDGVSSSEKVIKRLITSVKTYSSVFQTDNDDILSFVEAFKTIGTGTGQLEISERVKLALDYRGVESSINDLNDSIILLERIHQAIKQRHEVSTGTTDRKASKLAASLHIAREHAIALFNALACSWNAGCHQHHEAKIYLNGATIVNNQQGTNQTHFKKPRSHNFSVILSSKNVDLFDIWHENTIEVLDDESMSQDSAISTTAALTSPRPRVTITTPPATMLPHGPILFTDVHDLCTTIARATRERKLLKFFLASQHRIRCQHEACSQIQTYTHHSSINLEELLVDSPQTVIPTKIGLRNRMLLALNLATTLLQLHNTPWLSGSWSKQAINFLKRPATSPTPPSAATGGNNVPGVMIDYQHPLISKCFISGQVSGDIHTLAPKDALLELGIMLLELWHETTFEAFYTTTTMGQSGQPIPKDYWGRLRTASMWLDDPTDPPLPLYHAAISQCVKCFFGGTFSTPSWNDSSFCRALCKDLIAPLFESCKQWL